MKSRATRTSEFVEIDGRRLELSNRDKVLWPRDGYTKGDLVDYYRTVARWMLPYVRQRPLTLQRYPNGIDGATFFEKHSPKGMPAWIPTVTVPSDGPRNHIDFIVCDDEATLVYVANLAAIVLHVWTSQVGSLDVPDFVLFDLDPWEGCTIATLGKVALAFRAALEELGLVPLVKSTGGSGLHVVVPLEPAYTYDVAKIFAEMVARHVHAALPALTTLERMTAKRPAGTVYLDYVQVGMGKTLTAPLTVRPRDRAPVSMPLAWDAVEALSRKRAKETESEFARYTIRTAPALLAEGGDVWSAGWKAQRLEGALQRARTAWQ